MQEPANVHQLKVVHSWEESVHWRQAFIEAFVDTTRDWYRDHIQTLHRFSDGDHYDGYLWECLCKPRKITIQRFRLEVMTHRELLVMADDKSRDQRPSGPHWPFGCHTVARCAPDQLLKSLELLPEDLYVFDESLRWALAITHEHDHKRRLCLAVSPRT